MLPFIHSNRCYFYFCICANNQKDETTLTLQVFFFQLLLYHLYNKDSLINMRSYSINRRVIRNSRNHLKAEKVGVLQKPRKRNCRTGRHSNQNLDFSGAHVLTMSLQPNHCIITEGNVSKQVSLMLLPEDLSQTCKNKGRKQEMF